MCTTPKGEKLLVCGPDKRLTQRETFSEGLLRVTHGAGVEKSLYIIISSFPIGVRTTSILFSLKPIQFFDGGDCPFHSR